jgi:RES domain-containing protein
VKVAYRLCRSRYLPNSGKGAALHGGTWNPKGTEAIYAAESRALAALEVLAHFGTLPRNYVLSQINIPDDVKIIRIEVFWRGVWTPVEGLIAQSRSRDWFQDRESAVLSVPSTIIPEERNYVLNVEHPDFRRIQFLPSKPFIFDPRLKPSRNPR